MTREHPISGETAPPPGRGPRIAALVDLVLAVLWLPLAGLAAGYLVVWLLGQPVLPLVLVVQGGITLAGVMALCRWRGQPLAALGLRRPKAADLGRGLALLLAVIAMNMVLRLVAATVAPEMVSGQMERLVEVGGRVVGGLTPIAVVALSLFVGFYEELLARGLILERACRLLPGAAAPVAVSSLLFGLGHAYQGAFGVLQTAAIGAVLTVGVLRWGTLWPAILAHALINALSLLVLMNV